MDLSFSDLNFNSVENRPGYRGSRSVYRPANVAKSATAASSASMTLQYSFDTSRIIRTFAQINQLIMNLLLRLFTLITCTLLPWNLSFGEVFNTSKSFDLFNNEHQESQDKLDSVVDSVTYVADRLMSYNVYINSFEISDAELDWIANEHPNWVEKFFPQILTQYDCTLYSKFAK